MNSKYKLTFPAAAILLLVSAAYNLIPLFQLISAGFFRLISLLPIVASVIFAVALLCRSKNAFLLAGVGAYALVDIISKLTDNLLLFNILGILGALTLFALYAANILPQFENHKKAINSLWFIPPILCVLDSISHIANLLSIGFSLSLVFATVFIVMECVALFLAAHWITQGEANQEISF